MIAQALIAAGHDGQAQLIVQIRHENGALGSVTLDAESARKLMESCGVESVDDLRGEPWRRFLNLVPDN